MPSTMPTPCTRVVLGLLLATLMVITPSAMADDHADSAVVPPTSKLVGLLYSELSARHWQWLYSLPVDRHPLFDTAECSAGQSGPVWFLGGTFAPSEIAPGVVQGIVTRTCAIPFGTVLFFPIVDVECSTIEGNGTTEAELRDCAASLADLIDPESLHLEIDGNPVTNLRDYRVQSPLFTFGPLPENNVLANAGIEAPAGATSPAVSDGFFALVKPLSVGPHTIHFSGVLDASTIGGPIFTQDITYHITVIPRGQLQ